MNSKKFLLLFIIPVMFSFTHQTAPTILTGYWKLVCFSDLVTGQQDCNPGNDSIHYAVGLEFTDDGKIGTMKGKTTVNHVQGEYKIFESGKLKVESFWGTKICEHGWGSNFWDTIDQSSSFKYSANKDTLLILYDNDTKVMKFVH